MTPALKNMKPETKSSLLELEKDAKQISGFDAGSV
jgi:hypothetical protein